MEDMYGGQRILREVVRENHKNWGHYNLHHSTCIGVLCTCTFFGNTSPAWRIPVILAVDIVEIRWYLTVSIKGSCPTKLFNLLSSVCLNKHVF